MSATAIGRSNAASLAVHVDQVMARAAHFVDESLQPVADRMPGSEAFTTLLDSVRNADGGKYLRPRLVAASFFAYGGTDRELVSRVAGAQQLLHLGLCIHDDAIDQDVLRHGRHTVTAGIQLDATRRGVPEAGARRRGEAFAILAGDLAINSALFTLAEVQCPAEIRLQLVLTAVSAIERAIAGEASDVWSEYVDPGDVDPMETAELKTASYSVALPLALGAIAAGMTSLQELDTIREVASPLGIAYQLHDDDLGLFGDSAITGKSCLSDLRDGKRTEHLRRAVMLAPPEQREVLKALVGRPDLDEQGARRVLEIITGSGARASVLRTIDDQSYRTQELAAKHLPEPLAAYLRKLVGALQVRDR